ncbi:Xaa-Pro peptidase family protein [Desulfosarcina sp. OttesenSCG-928-A07]|nr:Xaa-Pro peptidase family protein [Desulfosarcina sp. OttesenSCG-928-A07]
MGTSFYVPADEIHHRTQGLQKKMQASGMGGVLIVQPVDLFYFSGTAQSGFLYIPAAGEPLLMIKKDIGRAKRESGLGQVVQISSIKELPDMMRQHTGPLPDVMGFELDVMPVAYFTKLRRLLGVENPVDASPLIFELRMIKSPWEIQQMDRTADLSRRTFEYMATAIRPGLTEMEFAGMAEAFSRKHGNSAMLRIRDFLAEGYAWHFLSGKSGGMIGALDSPASGEGTSAAFPCGAGNKRLEAGEPIMIDFASVMNGYHMDETRMFFVGEPPEKAMAACEAALSIQDAVLAEVRPGVTVGRLFDVSVAKAESLGYAEVYLGPPGNKVTFIGHGIGLELVEPPIIAKGRDIPLAVGMTLALEPKMVFEGEFSAGVEDVVQVTETGFRRITRIPERILVCR